MNVGSSGLEAPQMGSFDINNLNINMFMCHNEMTMTNTYFTMNVPGGDAEASTEQVRISFAQSCLRNKITPTPCGHLSPCFHKKCAKWSRVCGLILIQTALERLDPGARDAVPNLVVEGRPKHL